MSITWPDRGRKLGYWLNIALGADQGMGTLFGIDADESISSYVGRTGMGSRLQQLIDWVFLKLADEQEHCLNSIEKRFVLT